ncbi:MAG: hypothetical protein M3H12_07595 [Chromatiales bacterium]|nr:hypothetical protein [Gammaproteobacteria bacterium]
MENGTIHQLAFLTPDRMVAWKCLSLQALESQSMKTFAPVAYATRSPRFFSEYVNQGKLQSDSDSPDAVLWVISCPKFKLKGRRKKTFPPTLTAKIVIDEVVTGEVIRSWGSGNDLNLKVPDGEGKAYQDWRHAVSVRGAQRRATFRITRDFAMLTWKKQRKSNPRFTQLNAWKSVRTAIANAKHSQFLAHTDATACLSKIFGYPDLANLSLEERNRVVAWQLMSPRKLPVNSKSLVSCLEKLAVAGSQNTIFMSYRWNQQMEDVANIGLGLLEQHCGIWLDRLQIPSLKSRPIWRLKGKTRRKDPPQIELEQLLHNAIERSSLFLGLAGNDYERKPQGDPKGENWAQKERNYAVKRFNVERKPKVGLVDLGDAPEKLKAVKGLQWQFNGDILSLSRKISREARRS